MDMIAILQRPGKHWLKTGVATIIGAFFSLGALADPVRITIFHTNDLHQALEPLPRIAGYVAAHREKDPNTVFIDAGDWFDRGSSLATITRGEAIYGTMARMGYDMTIAGNHDWAYGSQRTLELIGSHNMPVLGTNLETFTPPFPEQIKSTIVRDIGGARVGFLGITLDTYSKNPKARPRLHATECHAATRKGITALKDAECDIIVAVTHLGYKKMKHETRSTHPSDIDLAKAFPDIDAIIGGHSHTLVSVEATEQVHAGTGTIIVQTGASGRYLGMLTLNIDTEKNHVDSFTTTQIKVTPELPELQNVASFLQELYAEHMPNAKAFIGTLDTDMAFHNFAYWYADFLRRETRADIVLLPRKTLYDEPRIIRKGAMNVEQLRGYFYDRYLCTSVVKGIDLIKYCSAESRCNRFNPYHHQGRPFSGDAIFYSGMDVTFDNDEKMVTFDLAPEKEYVLVTPWPFDRRDIHRYRHILPPRDVVEAAEPVPELVTVSHSILNETTVALLVTRGLAKRLSFVAPYPEPKPDWAVWTDHFESKLKPGSWKSPRDKK